MLVIAVAAEQGGLEPHATTLAAELGLEVVPIETPPDPIAALLVVTPERLEVRQLGTDAPGPVYADFVGGKTGYRRRGEGKSQPLARAVGLRKRPHTTVLDATAGLGQDGFVLASLGAEVILVERSPVVAALLADGVARALRHPDTRESAARLHLRPGDARKILADLAANAPEDRPDVVYLDPMYPHTGKSALKGKAMRLFRTLVGDDPDAAELLQAALDAARERVVVKRPRSAPVLGGLEPATAIVGKTTRYDLYITSHERI